jgi:mannosyltransferase OCH1-like enzyme
MIPQIMHYVWVGGAPLPAKYEVNIASWRETNPGFAIRAWTDETVAFEHPYLRRALALGNWANASNYLRLAVVLEHGGIYLDTDVMLVGSLAPFLRNGCFLGFQRRCGARRTG